MNETKLVTPKEMAEVEARVNAATPGPWKGVHGRVYCNDATRWYCYTTRYTLSDEEIKGNAQLVAHARTDIPRLIATIKAAWGRIAELERENQRLQDALPEKALTGGK